MILKIKQILTDVKSKGFFHLLSANLVIGLLGFGSQLFVAKFLTPLELGQIKTMQAFISVATILSGFGFDTAVLKLCSEKRTLEEKAFIFKRNLYFSVIPILFTVSLLFLLAKCQFLSPDYAVNKWMPLYMFVIPASVFTSLIIVYLQALKKIQLMAKAQVFIRILGFMALIWFTYRYGIIGFFLSSVFVGYIVLLPLSNLVKYYSRSKVFVKDVFKQSFYYSKWSVAANVLSTIGSYLDIFLLNYLIKDRIGFGYYSLATIFIFAMSQITITIQSIATPYFSEKSNDKNEFLRVLKKYEKLIIPLSFGVSIVAAMLVPIFIRQIYGRSYTIAGTYFQILTFRYFFWSCYALLGVAILGLGKMKYNFFSANIYVLISLLLSYVFILRYGLKGAAIAQAVASFISLFIVSLIFRHVINLHFGHNKI